MWSHYDLNGQPQVPMDYTGSHEKVLAVFKESFEKREEGNRAPLGIFLHAAWLSTEDHVRSLNDFLNWALERDHVWVVTSKQLITWMKDPHRISEMDEFSPVQFQPPPEGTDIADGWDNDGNGEIDDVTVNHCSYDNGFNFETNAVCPDTYPAPSIVKTHLISVKQNGSTTIIDHCSSNNMTNWNPITVYQQDAKVASNGYIYRARWWTQGDEPGVGEWGAWVEIEMCRHTILNSHGSLYPAKNELRVVDGSSAMFLITPDPGYRVSVVTVNGIPQSLIGTIATLNNVNGDRSLEVSFIKDDQAPQYKLSLSSRSGGKVRPFNETYVLKGSDQSVLISADPGYLITDVIVNGISKGPISQFTFSNVSRNYSLDAIFSESNISPTQNPKADATTLMPSTSSEPTKPPSSSPTHQPTKQPTVFPSSSPSSKPSMGPTSSPTDRPTASPTTASPTVSPSIRPTTSPIASPTGGPSDDPTAFPSSSPTKSPTTKPTSDPSQGPTVSPSTIPTARPSRAPTKQPTVNPSMQPNNDPSNRPSASPSMSPTTRPTINPTQHQTQGPTVHPTTYPTLSPSMSPILSPSALPTDVPSEMPSLRPTSSPTRMPSLVPSGLPTVSQSPSAIPTKHPTMVASMNPSTSSKPTKSPSSSPTSEPTKQPTVLPSSSPNSEPSMGPTSSPTDRPTDRPTASPTTASPTVSPSIRPTTSPIASPTGGPSDDPTAFPSSSPTSKPSKRPITSPSTRATNSPTFSPTDRPTPSPTAGPRYHPTASPTVSPSTLSFTNPIVSPSSSSPTLAPILLVQIHDSPSRSPVADLSADSDVCADSTTKFWATKQEQGSEQQLQLQTTTWKKKKSCAWVKRGWTAWKCAIFSGVKDACPNTCTNCCQDSVGMFKVKPGKIKTCNWAGRKREKRCKNFNVRQHCAKTCGIC